MRGRKPKPDYIRLLEEGVPQDVAMREAADVGHGAPAEVVALEAAPDYMTADQLRTWDATLKAAPPGLLTEAHRGTFTSYVIALDTIAKSSGEIAKVGELYREKKTGRVVTNPWLAIRRRAMQDALRHAAELGLTPVSQSRVRSSKRPTSTDNPFGHLKEYPG